MFATGLRDAWLNAGVPKLSGWLPATLTIYGSKHGTALKGERWGVLGTGLGNT